MDGKLGENAVGGLGTEGVEGFEGGFEEFLLGEVDAEYEDLRGMLVGWFDFEEGRRMKLLGSGGVWRTIVTLVKYRRRIGRVESSLNYSEAA